MDILVDEIPAHIRHLRPRGRDIIHVQVGGIMKDGTELVPTQEEIDQIVARWKALVKPGEGVRVMVTRKTEEAEVKTDATI